MGKFSRLKNKIEMSKEGEAILNNLVYMENKPYILNKLTSILSDDGVYIGILSDELAGKLYRLTIEYFNKCFIHYIKYGSGSKFSKLIDNWMNKNYYVYSNNGRRLATQKEIEAGVEELEVKIEKVVSDNDFIMLNILEWSNSGKLRYYKKAGLEYKYIEGKLAESDLDLIVRAGIKLKELMDWMKDRYDNVVDILTDNKKAKKIVYPRSAVDEIRVEISKKQLIYLAANSMNGEEYKEAKKIAYKAQNFKYDPLPEEISYIRRKYKEFTTIGYREPQSLPEDIEYICKRLLDMQKQEKIDAGDFACKIARTVLDRKKCSEKQLNILRNRLSAYENIKESNNIKESELRNEMDDIFGASDILGDGIMV